MQIDETPKKNLSVALLRLILFEIEVVFHIIF